MQRSQQKSPEHRKCTVPVQAFLAPLRHKLGAWVGVVVFLDLGFSGAPWLPPGEIVPIPFTLLHKA